MKGFIYSALLLCVMIAASCENSESDKSGKAEEKKEVVLEFKNQILQGKGGDIDFKLVRGSFVKKDDFDGNPELRVKLFPEEIPEGEFCYHYSPDHFIMTSFPPKVGSYDFSSSGPNATFVYTKEDGKSSNRLVMKGKLEVIELTDSTVTGRLIMAQNKVDINGDFTATWCED